ncbi:hypothetical protein NGRA_1274 [Nosema granulosis]|uniref:Uncharacterized protein n=1 Tax=Nosema granulosis TaxID=83296 RepID=A0A9P6GYS8_9MICR|nr:hypothetical protein NGRA_1274 [Nosema granulosis]
MNRQRMEQYFSDTIVNFFEKVISHCRTSKVEIHPKPIHFLLLLLKINGIRFQHIKYCPRSKFFKHRLCKLEHFKEENQNDNEEEHNKNPVTSYEAYEIVKL